jgi:hypothetical protein
MGAQNSEISQKKRAEHHEIAVRSSVCLPSRVRTRETNAVIKNIRADSSGGFADRMHIAPSATPI